VTEKGALIMRRFFLVLCVCLLTVVVLTTVLNAGAKEVFVDPKTTPDTNIKVYADIKEAAVTPAPVVYGVTLNWGSMTFDYTPTSAKSWDPRDHRTDTDASGGTWTCADGANRISVTNDSNAQIQYIVTYDGIVDSVKGTVKARAQTEEIEPVAFNGKGRTLVDRSSVGTNEASTDYVFLTLSGELPESMVKSYNGVPVEVGELTVTIMTNQP